MPCFPFICILVLMLSKANVNVSAVAADTPPIKPKRGRGAAAIYYEIGIGPLSPVLLIF